MKKKFLNVIFMILMTLSAIILIPLEVVLLVLGLLYLPIEYLIHRVNKIYLIKKYSPLETYFYKNLIKTYKSITDKNYIFDSEKRFFITSNEIILIKGFKKEKTDRINLNNYIVNKYNIDLNNYKIVLKGGRYEK